MANERDDERRQGKERTDDDDDELIDTDVDFGGDDDDELIDTDVDLGDDDDELLDVGEDDRGHGTGRTGGTEGTDPDIGGPGREPGTADEPGPDRGVTDEPGPETGVTDESGIGDDPGVTDPGHDRDTGMADTEPTGAGTTDADVGDTGPAEPMLTDDDIGKDVLDSRGERIGIVAGVEEQRFHVDPDPGIADRIKAALGWGDTDGEDTYTVQQTEIQDVNGDAVHLRQM